MAILTEKTNLKTGAKLEADMVNTISETAVAAYNLALIALKKTETASSQTLSAQQKNNDIY